MVKAKLILFKLIILYTLGILVIWIAFLGQMPADTTVLTLLVIFGPPALLLVELLIEKNRQKIRKKDGS